MAGFKPGRCGSLGSGAGNLVAGLEGKQMLLQGNAADRHGALRGVGMVLGQGLGMRKGAAFHKGLVKLLGWSFSMECWVGFGVDDAQTPSSGRATAPAQEYRVRTQPGSSFQQKLMIKSVRPSHA